MFFNSWKFKAGLAVTALCVVGMFWGVSVTQEKVQKMNQKAKPSQSSRPVPVMENPSAGDPGSDSAPPVPSKPSKPLYSSEWRIAGKLQGTAGDLTGRMPMIILTTKAGATRLVNAGKCKREDYEDYCEIDGEIITRFTGRHSGGYLDDQTAQAVALK